MHGIRKVETRYFMPLNKCKPSQKNTLLQAATSQPTKQSLQESIFSPTQEKLKNKKSSHLQKNKTSQPHNPQQTSTLTGYDFTQTDTATGHGRRRASANKVLQQWGLTCFYETFVRKQTVVHLSNFGAKKPPLRQYPNRWR
jgi:hypothetical protein